MSEPCALIRNYEARLKAGEDPNDFVPLEPPIWMTVEQLEEWLMWSIVHVTDGRKEVYRRMLYESWSENV